MFYRVSKVILEILSYNKQFKTNAWNIAAPAELNEFALIGENPVILRDHFTGFLLHHDLIMPLSRNHVAYHNTGINPPTLPPEHKFTIDLFQYLNAERYVCGCYKEYMERIVAFARHPSFSLELTDLHRELFEIFKR